MDDLGEQLRKFGCVGLGLILTGCAAVFAVVVGAVLAFIWAIERGNPGGEETRPIPDSDETVVIPVFDERLDPFRAEWNIYGRFEAWPALLPLAGMCEVAYEGEFVVKQEFARLGFEDCLLIDSPFHSQVAYLASGGDVAVVVVRGTDDTEDWLTNANVYLHPLPFGEIHSGFSGAYGMLQTRILDELSERDPKHVWVTGHSLGGAMALTCALDLVEYQARDIDGVITFGQPKIGQQRLSGHMQVKLGDRYVHFANERDAVPFLPTTFSHCGLLLRFYRGKVQKSSDYFRFGEAMAAPFTQQMEYEPVEDLPEIDPQLYQQFEEVYETEGLPSSDDTVEDIFGAPPEPVEPRGAPEAQGFLPWVEDHSMDEYVRKIRNAIDQASGSVVPEPVGSFGGER